MEIKQNQTFFHGTYSNLTPTYFSNNFDVEILRIGRNTTESLI